MVLLAKGKYQYWLENDQLIRLQGWARDGLSDEQIANNMGIHVATLYEWKNKYNEINEALKETKEICDRAVENALYQKCLQGDVTAIKFWLANRKKNNWRERIEHEASIKADITIEDFLKDNDPEL